MCRIQIFLNAKWYEKIFIIIGIFVVLFTMCFFLYIAGIFIVLLFIIGFLVWCAEKAEALFFNKDKNNE